MKPLMVLLVSASSGLAQPPDPNALDRYAQEGERALAQGRYEEAAQAYEKLRELSPETAEVHAKLGLIYFQQRDYARSVPALGRALKIKPTLPGVDILLAMSLSELGRYREALPGLQKGFRQTADSRLRRLSGLQLQRAYTGLEQDDKAVEVALELTRLYPDDPEVLYHGGRIFANYAYLTTVKLVRVAPGSVWRHQAAGEANESQGLYDAAVSEYRRVLALEPRRPGIHFRLGRTLLARAEKPGTGADAASLRAEAVLEFEQELQLDPTNANAAYELAEVHRRAGELDVSRRYFEQAVEHYPDFEQARIGLGRVLVAQGQADQGLPHLQKAIALEPEDEVAHYQVAMAYRALGRTAEAKTALAEFQRLRAARSRRDDAAALAPSPVTRQQVGPEQEDRR
jgi:tetratricopeptide (TPR) repeat protein